MPAGLARGVIVNRTAETVVRLLPPLVITEAEADEALGRLDAALGDVAATEDRLNDPTSSHRPAHRAKRTDAPHLHALITANLVEGHLLPRTLDELTVHADRFVVATRGPQDRRLRRARAAQPAGRRSPLARRRRDRRGSRRRHACWSTSCGVRARREGFDKLCAFTHAPGYFIQMGFSIVPHLWLPRRSSPTASSVRCSARCGQYAMVLPLDASPMRVDRDVADRSPRHA